MLGTLIDRVLRGLRQGAPSAPARRPFPEGGFVAFVTDVRTARRMQSDSSYTAELASTRLRLLIPARQLAERVPVWLAPYQEFARDPQLRQLGRAGAVVIGKVPVQTVIDQREVLEGVLESALRATIPVFADLSDDYAAFGETLKQPFLAQYQARLGRCCTFIVPCEALARAVGKQAIHGVIVVEDPYESAAASPVRTAASSPLRLVWFGNLVSVNLSLVEQSLGALAAAFSGSALSIEFLAQNSARRAVLEIGARLSRAHAGVKVIFSAWSLQATEEAIARCDFVWLPQEYKSAWGRVKSHNRLVAAIRGGRLAVASPVPAYEELSAYAWVGEDLAAGIRWALANPDAAAQRVAAGQRYVEERFSPQTVGRKWAAALGVA